MLDRYGPRSSKAGSVLYFSGTEIPDLPSALFRPKPAALGPSHPLDDPEMQRVRLPPGVPCGWFVAEPQFKLRIRATQPFSPLFQALRDNKNSRGNFLVKNCNDSDFLRNIAKEKDGIGPFFRPVQGPSTTSCPPCAGRPKLQICSKTRNLYFSMSYSSFSTKHPDSMNQKEIAQSLGLIRFFLLFSGTY